MMNMQKFIDGRFFEFASSLAALLIFFVLRAISSNLIRKQASRHGLDKSRTLYTNKFFNTLWLITFLLGLGFIWNVSFKEIFFSFFAIAGVALFANWSILSNITASVILFFNFPFKIGSRITIKDKDDSVTGEVKDITFFAILIKTADGNLVSYPNNVAITKAIVQLD